MPTISYEVGSKLLRPSGKQGFKKPYPYKPNSHLPLPSNDEESIYSLAAELSINEKKLLVKKTRKCWLITLILVIVLLVGFGLIGFFLYPRLIEVEFLTLKYSDGQSIDNNNDNVIIKTQLKKLTNPINGFGLELMASIKINNENYLGVQIDSIPLKIYLEDKEIGYGNLNQSIQIKSKDITNFYMPINLFIINSNLEANQILKSSQNNNTTAINANNLSISKLIQNNPLLKACQKPKNNEELPNINLSYSGEVNIGLLNLLKIQKPKFDGTFNLLCPFTTDMVFKKILEDKDQFSQEMGKLIERV